MGHKIALFVQSLAMVFGGFAMGFAYGWKLTLVILALSPLIAIAGALLGKVCKKPHSYWQKLWKTQSELLILSLLL